MELLLFFVSYLDLLALLLCDLLVVGSGWVDDYLTVVFISVGWRFCFLWFGFGVVWVCGFWTCWVFLLGVCFVFAVMVVNLVLVWMLFILLNF